jgi:hypothetical protein
MDREKPMSREIHQRRQCEDFPPQWLAATFLWAADPYLAQRSPGLPNRNPVKLLRAGAATK